MGYIVFKITEGFCENIIECLGYQKNCTSGFWDPDDPDVETDKYGIAKRTVFSSNKNMTYVAVPMNVMHIIGEDGRKRLVLFNYSGD